MMLPNFNVPYQIHEPYTTVNNKDEIAALESGAIIHKLSDKVPRYVSYNPDMKNCNYKTNGRGGNRYVDFCYGVFSKDRLEENETDFVFTIVKNPVKRIYDLYHYMQHEMKLIGDGTRKDIMRDAAKDYVNMSLEEFIDDFIYKDGNLEFKIYGIIFRLIDECVLFRNVPKYNFVGLDSYLQLSLHILGKFIGFDIPWEGRVTKPSTVTKECLYRYSELENILSRDLECYHSFKKNLHHLALEFVSPKLQQPNE